MFRSQGKGRAVLLNVSLAGYEAARARRGQERRGLRRVACRRHPGLRHLCSRPAGSRPSKDHPGASGLEVSRFRNGEAEYVGIVQGLPRDTTDYTNQLATWHAAQPVTISLPA